jgi:adenylate cyclase
MPKIEFMSDAKVIDVEPGESILQASLRAGIPHTHVCGGKARCTTCRVILLDGDEVKLSAPCKKERELARKFGFAANIRLACQAYISDSIKTRRLVIDDDDVDLALMLMSDEARGVTASGIEKKLTILFADIREFTSFSERQLPYDVVHMLNRYFYLMRRIIERNKGEIFNYMGDGLLALFGADDSANAVENSVRSAMEMLTAMQEMQTYLNKTYGQGLQIGIGIHSGDVVIGAINDQSNDKRMVIGDAVNVASRVESANKEMGTNLLVSQTVYDELSGKIETGKSCTVQIKGKSGKHALYEVLSLA